MTPHHNQRGHTVTDWVLMRNFEFGANLLAVSHGSIFALKVSAQVGSMDHSSPERRLTLGQIVHSIFNKYFVGSVKPTWYIYSYLIQKRQSFASFFINEKFRK